MEEKNWFKINSPSVIFETLDNEVILINLDFGYYYSLHGLAADIWKLIVQNVSQEQIFSHVSAHFQQSLEQVTATVQSFFDKLQSENLVVLMDKPASPSSAIVFSTNSAYEAPQLHKYDDMQNLLFLDPIHEVDEQGWPNQNVFETGT